MNICTFIQHWFRAERTMNAARSPMLSRWWQYIRDTSKNFMNYNLYNFRSTRFILLIISFTITELASNNAFAQKMLMSPKPPPATLSTSLPPQQSMLPSATAGLNINQGYFKGKDGVQIFYRMISYGKDTIVFVHGGYGLSIEDGALDIEMLANKGHTFIAYDQRGGGRSELVRDTTKLTMNDQIEDLEALRKRFKIQKLSLIGLSWGAAIIIYYTNRFPQNVSRLVFLSPMPPTTEYAKKRGIATDFVLGESRKKSKDSLFSLLENAGDTAYSRLFIQALSTFLPAYVTDTAHVMRARGNLATVSPLAIRNRRFQSFERYLGNPFDFRPLLMNIKVPALILEGEKTNVPLDATKEYAINIKNSKLILIPNAGHQNWLDQPEAVLDALDEFFKSSDRH